MQGELCMSEDKAATTLYSIKSNQTSYSQDILGKMRISTSASALLSVTICLCSVYIFFYKYFGLKYVYHKLYVN